MRLRGLELFLGLLGVVLDGVELAQDHAVLDALRLQRDDLLKLRNRQIQRIAGGRGRGWRVLPVAQLAQVDAPQQLVRVDVVGRALQQLRAVLSASCTRPVRKYRSASASFNCGEAGSAFSASLYSSMACVTSSGRPSVTASSS